MPFAVFSCRVTGVQPEPNAVAMKEEAADMYSNWGRIADVVASALEVPQEERRALIDHLCRLPNGSVDLSVAEAAVELIAAAEDADKNDALRSPFSGVAVGIADSSEIEIATTVVTPERIGPWKPIRRLGSGGMGVVYEAVRDDDSFDQHAAVKVVHPGFAVDFGERFLRERAVLAGLHHPGVAQFLDGGHTGEGLPWLAMEIVRGEPITRYCENRDCTVDERIALFLQACDAVAYAHQNLVVHRDLKPAHVLIDSSSEPPRAKLLDFGIAKLMEAGDDMLTGGGNRPLTPAYAAPEQLLGAPITTATDVYSLGLVLYQVLVGTRAYDINELTASEAERIVASYMPVAPSSIISDPASARRVRGDLDKVVLRAIAKEPHRRYSSAAAFADDLRRFLAGQPVAAQPDTLSYRLSKFVRRNRMHVAVGSMALAAIALIATLFTIGLAAERNKATDAAVEATQNAARAEAISGFLERVLRAPNTRWYVEGEAKGPETPIRAVLAEAAAEVESTFVDQPDIRADLHHILGDTYMSLGMLDETRYHHRSTLAIRRQIYDAPHPKLAEAVYYGAVVAESDLEVLSMLREAVAMQLRRPEGNNFPFMAQSLVDRELAAGNIARADTLALAAYNFADRMFLEGSDTHRYRGTSLAWHATLRAYTLTQLGELETADRWTARADSVMSTLEANQNFAGVWVREVLSRAALLEAQGRVAQAESLFTALADSDIGALGDARFPVPTGYEVGLFARGRAAFHLVRISSRVDRPVAARHALLAEEYARWADLSD